MPRPPAHSRPARARRAPAACGCRRCSCAHAPRCRCHVFNALIALTLWDLRRTARPATP